MRTCPSSLLPVPGPFMLPLGLFYRVRVTRMARSPGRRGNPCHPSAPAWKHAELDEPDRNTGYFRLTGSYEAVCARRERPHRAGLKGSVSSLWGRGEGFASPGATHGSQVFKSGCKGAGGRCLFRHTCQQPVSGPRGGQGASRVDGFNEEELGL